jgi:hypothetical protein
MFIFPTAELFVPKEVILKGFRQCVYATAAFAVGSIFFAPMISPEDSGAVDSIGRESSSETRSLRGQKPLAYVYLGIGILSYPLLGSFIGRLPSAQAIISMSQYLVLVALCVLCWIAWKRGKRRKLWVLLGIALLFPFVTMLTRGFAGYGIRAFLIIAAFVATFYRPRWHMVTVGAVLVYAGLSFYVGYMAHRAELRDAVWGGAGYETRWEQVEGIFEKTEAFTPTNPEHVGSVVGRLNLSYHVGLATEHIGKYQGHASGETVWQATTAMIPRVLWPSKPPVAGSQDIVATYTGQTFAVGTSVGVGHVLEWYVNFGTWGVVLGFLLFGTLVTAIDNRASFWLERGNVQQFVQWFLPGIAFLNVGGQFAALTSSFVAGWIAVWGINTFILPYILRKSHRISFSSPRNAPSQSSPRL